MIMPRKFATINPVIDLNGNLKDNTIYFDDKPFSITYEIITKARYVPVKEFKNTDFF